MREGDTGTSREPSQLVGFVIGVMLVEATLFALAQRATERLRFALDAAGAVDPHVDVTFENVIFDVLAVVLPLSVAIGLVSVMVGALFEQGVHFNLDKFAPDITRLFPKDPVQGLRERAWSVLRSLVLGGVVARGLARMMRDHAGDFAALSRAEPEIGLAKRVVVTCARELVMPMFAAMLVLAAAHFVLQKRSWRARLRMSKHEIQQEHRESEGDPELRAARDRVHRELLFSASLDRVRKASFVVTNPTHLACAVLYDAEAGDDAPELVARGAGDFAKRIVEAAREAGVPVFSDVPLARSLYELEVDAAIPESLYLAVATVLVELSRPP